MTTENETNFAEVLDSLTKAMGCEALRREEDGRVLFGLDGNMGAALFTVDAEETSVDTLVAVIVIGPAPTEADDLLDLMQANYLGAGSADGTFGIEEENSLLTLHRAFEFPMDPDYFTEEFSKMVGAARAQKAVAEGRASIAPDDRPDHEMIRI